MSQTQSCIPEISLFPYTFLYNLTFFTKQSPISILLPLRPFSIIISPIIEQKFPISMPFPKHILTCIHGSIRPLIFTKSMHLSLMPLTKILSLIRILYFTGSMRYISSFINFSYIYPTIWVSYCVFVTAIIKINKYVTAFLIVLFIDVVLMEYKLAFNWSGIYPLAIECKSLLFIYHFALPMGFSLVNLTLVYPLSTIKIKFPSTIRLSNNLTLII